MGWRCYEQECDLHCRGNHLEEAGVRNIARKDLQWLEVLAAEKVVPKTGSDQIWVAGNLFPQCSSSRAEQERQCTGENNAASNCGRGERDLQWLMREE